LRTRRESGFGLLLISMCATVMLGMLGLAFDLGRMFIVKTELQTFADASVLAACRQMDGTRTGVQGAHSTAATGPTSSSKPNGWNFGVNTVSTVTETYSATFAGTYDNYATAASNATNSYRFITLTASASLPLYFLSVIPGLPTAQPLAARAIAGQQAQTATFSSGGLVPVAPAAHNAADTKNFGLTPNVEYTLKWGNGSSTNCAGDLAFNPADSPSSHGFIDLGQGNGNSSLSSVIVYGGYPNSSSSPNHVSAGDQLGAVPGNRGAAIISAFAERSNQDSDQSSVTWEQYKASGTGNGRRLVTAPIYNPALSGGNGANAYITTIGFANFLLDPASSISGSSGPLCATYVGPASQTGGSSGGSDSTKIYNVVLFQ
jgi:Flp pilus assembly protein TadG